MGKWWENETPVTVVRKKNVLRLYPEAKKLMVSRPDWEDDHGEMKPGKTVTLDLEALRGAAEAREILAQALALITE